MRDLTQFPITDQEMVAALKEIAEEIKSGDIRDVVCGDMRAVLVLTAADIIAGRNIAKIDEKEFLAKMPMLEAYVAKLRAVADAAAELITDDREWGEEIIIKMGGHRRIRLADALKALKE